jgi:putative transposase
MPCFLGHHDLAVYVGLLNELAPKFECDVHSYVLMTNHVHLLLSPRDADAPSHLMKRIGQRYAQYFNRTHERTGTLWEGRFRSHIVDSESYLFTCQRYIELNPVRAGMVTAPWQYPWSSYRANAGLEGSLFVVPHRHYRGLGSTEAERHQQYRSLFDDAPSRSELDCIRHCINSGSALGREEFLSKLEDFLGRRAKLRPQGRPRRGNVPPGGKRGLTPV